MLNVANQKYQKYWNPAQPEEAFILLPLMVYWFLQILMWPVSVCVATKYGE